MPAYIVQLNVAFDRRPSRAEQAFLGPLSARVQPWGSTDLLVELEVRASDFGAALSDASAQVVDRLGGELQIARVALAGGRIQRPGWWRRWRRRAA